MEQLVQRICGVREMEGMVKARMAGEKGLASREGEGDLRGRKNDAN